MCQTLSFFLRSIRVLFISCDGTLSWAKETSSCSWLSSSFIWGVSWCLSKRSFMVSFLTPSRGRTSSCGSFDLTSLLPLGYIFWIFMIYALRVSNDLRTSLFWSDSRFILCSVWYSNMKSISSFLDKFLSYYFSSQFPSSSSLIKDLNAKSSLTSRFETISLIL